MNQIDAAQAEYFALYLPDGLPLTGRNARLEINRFGEVPSVFLTLTLAQDCARDLAKAGLLGDLVLPDRHTPLEAYLLELELEAKTTVCKRFEAFLTDHENAAAALLDGKGPRDEGEKRNVFLNVASYNRRAYSVHEIQLASDDVIELAKKPPEPL